MPQKVLTKAVTKRYIAEESMIEKLICTDINQFDTLSQLSSQN